MNDPKWLRDMSDVREPNGRASVAGRIAPVLGALFVAYVLVAWFAGWP